MGMSSALPSRYPQATAKSADSRRRSNIGRDRFIRSSGVTAHGQEDGKVDQQRDDGEKRPADRSDGECEPEYLFGAVVQEWSESQDRREDRQRDRDDFVVESFQVECNTPLAGNRGACILLVDKIDAGIDDDAAQQDECREAALVEDEVRPAEGEENSDATRRGWCTSCR